MSTLTKLLVAAGVTLSIGVAALSAQQFESAPPDERREPSMISGWFSWFGPHHHRSRDDDAGPGRMRGYGMMGPGMMEFGLMGPGGMGGFHAFGMGQPMMGGGALTALDLDATQRKKLLTIQDAARKKNWALMGAMHDEMARLRDAFVSGEQRDRAAILAANQRMFELRQQMLENALDSADQVEKLLTPQQRETLKKRWGPAWLLDGS